MDPLLVGVYLTVNFSQYFILLADKFKVKTEETKEFKGLTTSTMSERPGGGGRRADGQQTFGPQLVFRKMLQTIFLKRAVAQMLVWARRLFLSFLALILGPHLIGPDGFAGPDFY